MASYIGGVVYELLKRETDDPDSEDEPEAGRKEIYASWALFILIALLIFALFASYMLQHKKVQAVHETVISIFAGMAAGLVIRVTEGTFIQQTVSFDYQFFFNLLLPPIILASGYELHQANFFRHIGTILTFAFAGTFISSVVLGLFLWLWTRLPLDGFRISFVEAISVGATLSATDPVTILAIFNTYKVDPKLYTIIFGEAILNDAVAIVIFDTAQRYSPGKLRGNNLTVTSLFEAFGIFLLIFFGSLLIGVIIGIGTALLLKLTLVRRHPKIESCLVILIAYASYFFANGALMSGIVSLLFCGITLKHYAYYNMSRRTQLTTKYVFSVLAQLSENFIFIYLGLTLFTETLEFKPIFIIITVVGICAARWCSVFPLSKVVNAILRFRGGRGGREPPPDEIPYSHQVMLFWAGLRGAVGVALATGLAEGKNKNALRATVLIVVVLTVIIFGGTTAKMLEIMNIRTGVVEEIDSDDEFDIENASNGTYYKSNGVGYTPKPRRSGQIETSRSRQNGEDDHLQRTYSSGTPNLTPPVRPTSRNNSMAGQRDREFDHSRQSLLSRGDETPEDDISDSDLPPAARQPRRKSPPSNDPAAGSSSQPVTGNRPHSESLTASGALHHLFAGTSEEQAAWFKQLDEDFIKPKLLLDQNRKGGA